MHEKYLILLSLRKEINIWLSYLDIYYIINKLDQCKYIFIIKNKRKMVGCFLTRTIPCRGPLVTVRIPDNGTYRYEEYHHGRPRSR